MWSEFVCVNPIAFSVILDDMSEDELTIRLLSCQTDFNVDEDYNPILFQNLCYIYIIKLYILAEHD